MDSRESGDSRANRDLTVQPARAPQLAAGMPTRLDRWHWLLVPALLSVSAILAVTSLIGDSVTFDETAHLVAGMSYLKTGDFRLSPEHPPLAKLWAAWPLLFVDQRWPAADDRNWVKTNLFAFGRRWLFELNDGQRLVVTGRFMMVVLLLATCLTTYALARTLFGPAAGLLALALATLSPSLLAHGRLVTTDLPVTFGTALSLLTFAWLLRRVTWGRLLAAALALAVTSLTKFSWPLILPALAVMAGKAIFGSRGLEIGYRPRPPPPARGEPQEAPQKSGAGVAPAPWCGAARVLNRRRDRAAVVLGCSACMAVVMWVGIWTCYGWRASIVAPNGTKPDSAAVWAALDRAIQKMDHDQESARQSAQAHPLRGGIGRLLRGAADAGLLPDGYLLGLMLTLQLSGPRPAYLLGKISETGFLTYFPVAFAIKTPLATLLLLLAGVAALALRRAHSRDTRLLSGLVVFAVVVGGYLILGRLNIGHRHLLPAYPVVFVLASASATWLSSRVGRGLVAGAVLWLLGANLWIHPHYLSYFNELVGGPSRGQRYLVDSNLDWGQDLLRLAHYARQHPDEPIKLAYFGSATPTRYVECTALPSFHDFKPRAALDAGTYVVSVTLLAGVHIREVRDSFWNAANCGRYRELGRMVDMLVPGEPAGLGRPPDQAAQDYQELRYRRLLNRLRHRPPDARIGYSLLVYRLTDADVQELTRP